MTDDELIGLQLDEYRLEALLGQGGMARVYRAVDVQLERLVAIKVIDSPYQSDSAYLARFRREGQAIARLEHPHIVRLYRYGQAHDLLYMAMQYVEGADLGSVLDSYRQEGQFIEPEEARRIMWQAGDALDYAHRKGVIHRDVKPANILIDKQGQVLLSDFGLALMTEVGTRGEVFGSPHYISPEQAISSAGAVPQSDLYSLGVILYEMFTGALPFDAPEALDIALLHLKEPPPLPSSLRPDLDIGVEAVILKALAKEPDERFKSGSALVEALDTALSKTKPHSAPVGQTTIAQRVNVELEAHPLPPLPAEAPAVLYQEPARGHQAPTIAVTSPLEKLSRFPWVTCAAVVALVICIAMSFMLSGMWLARDRGAQIAIAEQTVTAQYRMTATANAIFLSGGSISGSQTASGQAVTASVAGTLDDSGATPSPSAQPSQPPAPTAAPSNTPHLEPYRLLLLSEKDESLFVINLSTEPFPIALLTLGNSMGIVEGAEWGIQSLVQGACVTLWKDRGNPKEPKDADCEQVGERLTRGNNDRFWESDFNIYFNKELIEECEAKRCEVSIAHP